MTIRVAVVAWKLRHIHGDSGFFGHFHDLVGQAHDEGAEIVVFPELPSVELLSLAPDLEDRHVPSFLVQYSAEIEGWLQRIGRSSGMILVGGSHFRMGPDGMNVACPVAYPNGSLAVVVRNRLTPAEKAMWPLSTNGDSEPQAEPRLGVTVGYDVEFPEFARKNAESGSVLQCVPAYSPNRISFQRTRVSCLARAIETQTFVAHASLVGTIEREPATATFGSSAILAPLAPPFDREVLVETWPNDEGVVVSDLDFSMLEECRAGSAGNWEDRVPTSRADALGETATD